MKVLWTSDAIDLFTGYGTQGLTIVTGLKELGHDVITLGWKAFVEKNFKVMFPKIEKYVWGK